MSNAEDLTPEARFVLALQEILREFDKENAGAPDAHAQDCGCELCAFVAAIREAVTRPPSS